MKVIILAGGLGTRLSEETGLKPKPMVEIGGKPILWHIMKIYSYYGFNDFIILTGYKSNVIKDYFLHYYEQYSDITIDMENNSVEIHRMQTEPWKVTMLYTGIETMTGSRIKKAREYIGDEPFLLTYGDGVADIDINELIKFHKSAGKTVTVTAVKPYGRFGALILGENNIVTSFVEKPKGDDSWINGGFFVCEPQVFDFIPEGDDILFEKEPLETLTKTNNLAAYTHNGYWQPMDTVRDRNTLNAMWNNGTAKWAFWKKEK